MDYIKLQNGLKVPCERHSYYSTLDQLTDAAIALDNYKNVVFVDFDNLAENKNCEERILNAIKRNYKCNLIVKTTRGFHLYYKTDKKLKQWTKGFLTCGLQCDGKMGNAYGVIKQNGIVRNYEGELSFDNLTDLPDVLLPMYIGKNFENLCGLKSGDGRHNKLLSYLSQVRVNYQNINLEEIAKFINNYVFDEALNDNELENILDSVLKYSEENKSNQRDSKKTILINLGKNIVKKYDTHVSDNKIYFLSNQRYICNDNLLMKLVYKEYEYSKGEYDEILFQIKANSVEDLKLKAIISLKNGALIDGIFYLNNRDYSCYYIDAEYNKDAYDKDVDEFLQFISNNNESDKNDIRIIIEEMIGHCLMTKMFPQKIFLLVGDGANGKSTLLNMLYEFFKDLACNIPIDKIKRDDYVAELNNKLVNISDDVDFGLIKSSQKLKTLASGDMVPARELYSRTFYFKSCATLIFSMNDIVSFNDNSYGLQRRLCIIPFNNKVTTANPNIINKLTTDNAKSYLLRLGIEGMNRIIENGYKLTDSKSVEYEINSYLLDNDSIYAFIKTNHYQIINRAFKDTYEDYGKFCDNNNYTKYSSIKFSKAMKTYGYVTTVKYINDKSIRCYKKI